MTWLRAIRSGAACIALTLALALSAGCGSYEGQFQYAPSPAHVVLTGIDRPEVPGGQAGADGHVLAAVEGLRTVLEQTGEQTGEGTEQIYVFDVRLRIDHDSEGGAWTFDPAAAQLVTGALVRLESIERERPTPLSIPSGSTVDVALTFALPAGSGPDDLDLSGLHLTLRLDRDGNDAVISAGFQRRVAIVVMHDHWGWPGWHDPWMYYGYRPRSRGRRGRSRPRSRR